MPPIPRRASSSTCAHRRATGIPLAPAAIVGYSSASGWRSSTGRHAAKYGSTACTASAVNIGSSLWLCTIEAPDSIPARAASVISAGVRGTWRLR